MNRTSLRLAAVVCGLALMTAACGGDVSKTKADKVPSAAGTGAVAATTPAAVLRAQLTHLLTAHVYLAGLVTGAAAARDGNLKDPTVLGALKALDANSVALSSAVGSHYPDAQAPVLAAWRRHIGFLVSYALGKTTRNKALTDKAVKDLDGWCTSFGQLLHSVVPGLPAATVTDELKPGIAAQSAAIDAQIAGSPTQFALLETAASDMPGTAKLLAKGMADDRKLAGRVDAPASTLRAALTGLLSEHALYTAIALNQAVTDGGDLRRPATSAAVAALDTNSIALAKAVGSLYPDAEARLLTSWRQHIEFLLDYALGKATTNAAMTAKAVKDLDAWRTSFSGLLHSIVPELPAATLAAELKTDVASVLLTIDSFVAGGPHTLKDLSAAAALMPGLAASLAIGISTNKKLS